MGKEDLESKINTSKDNGKVVILDFFTDWCQPCKTLSKVLDELKSENENLEVVKIDAGENTDVAIEWKVRSVPTVFLYSKKGEKKFNGSTSKSFIQSLIDELRWYR